jgi:hypothetical protein
MALRYDDIAGMTQREFKRKIQIHTRKLPRDLIDDVKDFLSELKGQLNSTDEEMFLNMQDLFNEEAERRESYFFRLKNMVIHGSFLFSLFFVTSLLSPRHIRWSLFFCNIVMLWFICAVFFNNTKDPLAVPDFVSINLLMSSIEQKCKFPCLQRNVDFFPCTLGKLNSHVCYSGFPQDAQQLNPECRYS